MGAGWRHIGDTRSPILASDNENPHFTDQTSPSSQVNWNSQLRRRISTQEMRTEEGGQICHPGARNCRLICLPITRGSEHGLLLVPQKTRRTRPALTPARAPLPVFLRYMHRSSELNFLSVSRNRSLLSMCRRVSKKLQWDRPAMRRVAVVNEKLGKRETTLNCLVFL